MRDNMIKGIARCLWLEAEEHFTSDPAHFSDDEWDKIINERIEDLAESLRETLLWMEPPPAEQFRSTH